MAMTVKEICQLQIAKDFQLIAGENGLKRKVERVNLMDFEYDTWEPEAIKTDGMFDEKAIVITSMICAKDNPDKMLPVIRQLYMDGISAVAIKSVYYQSLPAEVCEFAEEISLPIFLFDSERNYSDDIVVGLTMALEQHNNISVLEEKLTFILQSHFGSLNKMKVSEELFARLKGSYRFYYFIEKELKSSISYDHQFQNIRNQKVSDRIVLPYQYGYLVVQYGGAEKRYQEIADDLELAKESYYCGISKKSEKREEIAYKIKEAVYACNFIRNREGNTSICYFETLGIWQLILPNQDNYWMRSYCEDIIEKIKSYDLDGNSEMFDTVVSFVENGCDIGRTAESIVVHKNTVRYRINKVKEILNMENDVNMFHEVLCLAVYFSQIEQQNYLFES